MKVKMRVLVESRKALMLLGGARKLPSNIIIDVIKNIKAVKEELEVFDLARQSIIEEHAEKNENDEFIVFDDGSLKTKKGHGKIANEENNKLLDTVVDVSIKKIAYDLEMNPANLTPLEILSLEYMFKLNK